MVIFKIKFIKHKFLMSPEIATPLCGLRSLLEKPVPEHAVGIPPRKAFGKHLSAASHHLCFSFGIPHFSILRLPWDAFFLFSLLISFLVSFFVSFLISFYNHSIYKLSVCLSVIYHLSACLST